MPQETYQVGLLDDILLYGICIWTDGLAIATKLSKEDASITNWQSSLIHALANRTGTNFSDAIRPLIVNGKLCHDRDFFLE